MKLGNKKHVERAVLRTIRFFIIRAKSASQMASKYKRMSDGGTSWAFDRWLEWRSKRGDWIQAARDLRDAVISDPVPHIAGERRLAKIIAKANAA